MKGSIIERGKDRWLLKYDAPREPGGPRRQLYKTVRGSKRDAQRKLRELLSAVDSGTHVDPSRVTVAEWAEQWLRNHGGNVEAKTLERYGELLRLHVVPVVGEMSLQRLRDSAIQNLYSQSKLAPRTVQHVHRVFKQCLSAAVRLQLLSRNPADGASPPKKKTAGTTQKVNALDRDGLSRLLRGLEASSIRLIVLVAAATGARRSEILALRWCDVDLAASSIRIERAFEDTRAHGVRAKAPKNLSSARTIGLDAGTLAHLASERAKQAEAALQLGIPLAKTALVFSRGVDNQDEPRHPRAVTKEFARWAPKLGFRGFRFHDLRHTHATLLLEAGVPVNAVAARLGHSTPVITLSTYGHVLRRAEEHAVEVAASFMRTDCDQNGSERSTLSVASGCNRVTFDGQDSNSA